MRECHRCGRGGCGRSPQSTPKESYRLSSKSVPDFFLLRLVWLRGKLKRNARLDLVFPFGGGLIQKRGILTTNNGIWQLPHAFRKKKNYHQDLPQGAPRRRKPRVCVQRFMVTVKKGCVWWDFNSRRGMKGDKVQMLMRYRSEDVSFCE